MSLVLDKKQAIRTISELIINKPEFVEALKLNFPQEERSELLDPFGEVLAIAETAKSRDSFESYINQLQASSVRINDDDFKEIFQTTLKQNMRK